MINLEKLAAMVKRHEKEIQLLKNKAQATEEIIIDGPGVYRMRNLLKATIFDKEKKDRYFPFYGMHETGSLAGSGYTNDSWLATGRISRIELSEFDIIEKIRGYDD